MNDRALREIVISLGGVGNAFLEKTDSTSLPLQKSWRFSAWRESARSQAASRKHDRWTDAGSKVRKSLGSRSGRRDDSSAQGCVCTQSCSDDREHPALIHGGPFANIAHGCNSVIATKTALKLGDYVVTEAGFGAISALKSSWTSSAAKQDSSPLVRSCRNDPRAQDARRRSQGCSEAGKPAGARKRIANLSRHVENVRKFGVPAVVCINRFSADTEAEFASLKSLCESIEVECILSDHWAKGGPGAADLAKAVLKTIDTVPSKFAPIYPDDMPLWKRPDSGSRGIRRG